VAGAAAARDVQGQEFLADVGGLVLADIGGRGGEEPAVAGFGRGVLLVQILAVEGVAHFQSQGVTGAESGRQHPGIGGQGFPQGAGGGGREEEFVAEFAGVAGAADQQFGAGELGPGEIEVFEAREVARHPIAQDLEGQRSLEVDLGGGLGIVGEQEAFRQTALDAGEIGGDAGGVDHEHVAVGVQAIDDEVVDDAAGGI